MGTNTVGVDLAFKCSVTKVLFLYAYYLLSCIASYMLKWCKIGTCSMVKSTYLILPTLTLYNLGLVFTTVHM